MTGPDGKARPVPDGARGAPLLLPEAGQPSAVRHLLHGFRRAWEVVGRWRTSCVADRTPGPISPTYSEALA